MEGKFIKRSEPPTLDGMTGHAGEFPNCRCYPAPVIPRTDSTQRAFFKGLPTQEEEKKSGEKLFKSQWEKTIAANPEVDLPPLVPHEPGQPLFNVKKAFIPKGKLEEYSLNSTHGRGGDKAKVWEASIDATPGYAREIEKQVYSWLPFLPAEFQTSGSKYGSRFKVTVPITGPNGKTVDVTTTWIYDRITEKIKNALGEEEKKCIGVHTTPRLTTIYVDKKSVAF